LIDAAIAARANPAGVAESEYDSYVGGVYKLLVTHANRSELFFHLWQIETQHMGLSGNRRTEAVVDRLLTLRDEMERA